MEDQNTTMNPDTEMEREALLEETVSAGPESAEILIEAEEAVGIGAEGAELLVEAEEAVGIGAEGAEILVEAEEAIGIGPAGAELLMEVEEAVSVELTGSLDEEPEPDAVEIAADPAAEPMPAEADPIGLGEAGAAQEGSPEILGEAAGGSDALPAEEPVPAADAAGSAASEESAPEGSAAAEEDPAEAEENPAAAEEDSAEHAAEETAGAGITQAEAPAAEGNPDQKEAGGTRPGMVRVVGVRFRTAGRIYYFAPGNFDLKRGCHVVVETARGMEYGFVVGPPMTVPKKSIQPPLRPVLRISTEEDDRRVAHNREREREAFRICRERIQRRGLEMKLIDAEYTFDNSKVLFYFTADGRIDFRELVKDLAGVFRTRIELRQVGVRDETKILGGYGSCGRPLCCHTWLSDFVPVSIKMAKEQNLSLNPGKISGVCGRLMCCLKNEAETYEELNRTLPHAGDEVESADGMNGLVESVNILRQTARIIVEVDDEKELREYDVSELTILRRRKRGTSRPSLRREQAQRSAAREGGSDRRASRGAAAAERRSLPGTVEGDRGTGRGSERGTERYAGRGQEHGAERTGRTSEHGADRTERSSERTYDRNERGERHERRSSRRSAHDRRTGVREGGQDSAREGARENSSGGRDVSRDFAPRDGGREGSQSHGRRYGADAGEGREAAGADRESGRKDHARSGRERRFERRKKLRAADREHTAGQQE